MLQKLGIQGNTSLAEHSEFSSNTSMTNTKNGIGLSRYSKSWKTPAAFDTNSALAPFLFLNNGTEFEGWYCLLLYPPKHPSVCWTALVLVTWNFIGPEGWTANFVRSIAS